MDLVGRLDALHAAREVVGAALEADKAQLPC
jgi:hypothetical protein